MTRYDEDAPFKSKYFSHSLFSFQLLLLQESWKDLFLLHLSQWAIPWDLTALFSARQAHLTSSGAGGAPLLADDRITDLEIKTMQEILGRFRQISPDGTECGCLKAIVLFKPGTSPVFPRKILF